MVVWMNIRTAATYLVLCGATLSPSVTWVQGQEAGFSQQTGALAANPRSLSSQSRDSVRQTSDSTPPWITRRELAGLGLSLIATVAISPLDNPASNELQEQHWQGNEALHSLTQSLAFAGGPGPFVVGGSFYILGKIARAPGLAIAGEHITAAVLLAASVTALGKGMAGRALPGVKTGESFEWARGFHRNNGPFVSFPSGHTAAGFALAASLTEEAAAWRPGTERFVGPAAYGVASAIGLARVYQHVHWMSDLPLAVAIGTWSGLSVESHVHRSHTASAAARAITSVTVQSSPTGATLIGFSLPFGSADR